MGSVLLLTRLLLAAVFTVAGVAKLADLAGSRKSLLDFGLPAALARPFALLLPFAELICAAALLPASSAWWAACAVAALLALFIAGIGVSLARGRKPNCHCFGQLSSEPVGPATLVRNALLLALAGLVIVEGREDPGAWPEFPALMTIESAVLAAFAVLAVAFALMLWLLFQMLQQNGRLLVRLEAVEKKLNIDPNAKAVPGLPVGDPAPPFPPPPDPAIPALLVFTGDGCGACEALKPELATWQLEHAERLAIVTISDNPELSKAYLVTATPSAQLVTDGKIASPLAEGADDIRKLVRRSTLPPPAKKGDALPALRLPDLDGATVDLASLRGRRTLLLFWSTTCGYCQQMLDDLKKWESARTVNSPDLLVISSGTPEANRQQGFRAPVLLDADWGAGTVLGAGGTPSAVIIDEEGKVATEVGVGAPAVLALAGSSINS